MYIKEDDLEDSELKIGEEFNNCPSGKAIKERLDKVIDIYSFVDIKEDYWKNEDDTLVISWLWFNPIDERVLNIGKLATEEFHPDEFDYKIIDVTGGKRVIIRMWWD